MKNKIISTIILAMLFVAKVYGQETYQIFINAGFKVKCGCELYENTPLISVLKQQGEIDVFAAYVCAENEDNPDIGVINNINIYDLSESYKNFQPSEYEYLENKILEKYAIGLKNSGIAYTYTTYQGVSAIEYTFDQQDLPTKAIVFFKDKKSYLIQVGTRKNLTAKYNLLKTSFVIL